MGPREGRVTLRGTDRRLYQEAGTCRGPGLRRRPRTSSLQSCEDRSRSVAAPSASIATAPEPTGTAGTPSSRQDPAGPHGSGDKGTASGRRLHEAADSGDPPLPPTNSQVLGQSPPGEAQARPLPQPTLPPWPPPRLAAAAACPWAGRAWVAPDGSDGMCLPSPFIRKLVPAVPQDGPALRPVAQDTAVRAGGRLPPSALHGQTDRQTGRPSRSPSPLPRLQDRPPRGHPCSAPRTARPTDGAPQGAGVRPAATGPGLPTFNG